MVSKIPEPPVVLFMHTKPVRLIVSLKKGPQYATILSKEIDCTYSHTVKLLDNFKKFEAGCPPEIVQAGPVGIGTPHARPVPLRAEPPPREDEREAVTAD